MECNPIAVIRTDFPSKFGIPRQSGILEMLPARIVMEPPYRDSSAFRGLEGFSHLWLLWQFSETEKKDDGSWSPTVRPPRLGGNTRMGVFATRSPNRPNPIGLSLVKFVAIDGCDLIVAGADLMDKTPILDIKPYLPFADCRPEATGGFAEPLRENKLRVVIPEQYSALLSSPEKEALPLLLAEDPRPHYQNDPERVYGFPFADVEVKFRVDGEVLTVLSIEKRLKTGGKSCAK